MYPFNCLVWKDIRDACSTKGCKRAIDSYQPCPKGGVDENELSISPKGYVVIPEVKPNGGASRGEGAGGVDGSGKAPIQERVIGGNSVGVGGGDQEAKIGEQIDDGITRKDREGVCQ